MSRTRLSFKYLFIILIILFISIGFAYLSTNLDLIGSTIIKKNSWDIYFDNVNVLTGDDLEVVRPATEGTGTIELSYEVNLNKPGDVYCFDVDVVNDGTIDAMISLIENTALTEAQKKYLNYSITYKDGIEVEENNLLKANDKETFTVKIEFLEDVNLVDLPESVEKLSFNLRLEYVQKDEEGEERQYTIKFDSNGGEEAQPSSIVKKGGEEIGDKYFKAFEMNRLSYNHYNGKNNPMVIEILNDSSSPTGKIFRLERTENGSDVSGYYWWFTKLPENEPYYFETMVKSSGNWLIGHEQGPRLWIRDFNEYTEFSNKWKASSSIYNAIICYDYNKDLGDYVNIAYARLFHLLPEATRDGYTFAGWYTEKDGGTRITDTTKVEKNTTYYAHWTKNS